MGNSLPPPAGIDLVGSYARRNGSEAELVLWEPKSTLVGDDTTVALRRGRTNATGRVARVSDEHGDRLVCYVSRAQLDDGTWSITLRSPEGDEPVDARLLVQGDRPLVLLWGAKGGQTIVPTRAVEPAPRKKAAAAAGRVLERALAPLPVDRAIKTRRAVRRTARRVLP